MRHHQSLSWETEDPLAVFLPRGLVSKRHKVQEGPGHFMLPPSAYNREGPIALGGLSLGTFSKISAKQA